MEREAIQREWSCAKSATRYDAVECADVEVSVCPQVCRTDRKPSWYAEMAGIGSDVEQRGRTGLEQQGKQLPLVLPHQRHKRMWEAEDEMIVADGQQLLLSLGQPLIASAGLVFRAVPVTAGVIRYGLDARSSGTHRDDHRGQRTIASSTLRCGQVNEALYRCRKLSPVMRTMLGHLEGRPAHRFLSCGSVRSAICSSGLMAAWR